MYTNYSRLKQLFIIGNGFDLAHKLPTKYQDFYNFLKRPEAADDEKILLDVLIDHIGDALNPYNELDHKFYWENFESLLGEADFQQDMPFSSSYDDKSDDDPDYQAQQLLPQFEVLRSSKGLLSEIFERWISTIDVNQAKPDNQFAKYIRKNQSTFLSFNYTMTLEYLYDEWQVMHIHGKVGDGNIMVGHGNPFRQLESHKISEVPLPLTASMVDIEEYCNQLTISDELYNAWHKDVPGNIERHKGYFESLRDVDEIYTFGFSYNKVDSPYIVEIIHNLKDSSNTNWFLKAYNHQKNLEYKDKIREWGFKGRINEFF